MRRWLVRDIRSSHGLRRQRAFVDLADLICKLNFRQGLTVTFDVDLTLPVGNIGLQGSIIVYKLYLRDFLNWGCGLDKRLTFQKTTTGFMVSAGHGNGSIGRYVCDLWFFLGEKICIIVELSRFFAQRAAVDSRLRTCLI